MDKKELRFDLGRNLLGPNHMLGLANVIHALALMGYKVLQDCDWEKITKENPQLLELHKDKEVHVELARLCLEVWERWEADAMEKHDIPDINIGRLVAAIELYDDYKAKAEKGQEIELEVADEGN